MVSLMIQTMKMYQLQAMVGEVVQQLLVQREMKKHLLHLVTIEEEELLVWHLQAVEEQEVVQTHQMMDLVTCETTPVLRMILTVLGEEEEVEH